MEELLYWHNVCGHHDIGKTPKLMKTRVDDLEPMIIPKLPESSSYNIPLYKSCLHGKRRLISMHSVTSKPTVEHSDIIRKINLLPESFVSTDQYKYRVKDRLANTTGKEDSRRKYLWGNPIYRSYN